MVDLESRLQAIADPELREQLTERLDIVQHKIKFMDAVPVFLADTFSQPVIDLYDVLTFAGATQQMDAHAGVYILYAEPGKGLNDLMRDVPPALDGEWPAVKNNRIVLIDRDAYDTDDLNSLTGLIEDLAEMIHPGAFIFGHEGVKWIRMGV